MYWFGVRIVNSKTQKLFFEDGDLTNWVLRRSDLKLQILSDFGHQICHHTRLLLMCGSYEKDTEAAVGYRQAWLMDKDVADGIIRREKCEWRKVGCGLTILDIFCVHFHVKKTNLF